MSEKDLHNSFEDLSIVGNCSSKELKECLKRIEKLETENKKIELIEETIKSLKKENTSDEKFKLIEKNFYKLFNRYTTIYDEKLENENKLKKENEKIQIEKNLLEKQVEQLQNENKKISDLFEKFTNKKIEETENLKTQIEESLNKNNEKLNEEQDLNALINKKYKEIEENKKNEKMIGQTNKLVKEQYTQLNKELVQLYSNFLKKAVYVSLPNKINEVGNEYSFETCCDKKCINSNLLNGSCISKYSYVNVNEDGFIKYYPAETYVNGNNQIKLYAQHSISKELGNLNNYSLFYFEIKIIMNPSDYPKAIFGFLNQCTIILDNYYTYNTKFINGDVFGCGIVYPPNKEINYKPYLFFTKNGNKIKDHLAYNEETDKFRPYIELRSCSVEINFGNDLKNKPFIYDVYNNLN